MIDEITGNCDAAGLTLLHVLRERLDAARLAALAGSDFDGSLDRNRDLVSGPQLSVWNHACSRGHQSNGESPLHEYSVTDLSA
ncbi:hypothetical protein [Allomesorhizobium camelthorni]|uniref:Uncharacterized protein n=1 Tax=Allomesorhizobium camelthorni TaxID=475069 RepID=A0A6G4WK07_9HYPH|nr:hypothetical protein [Mesorhizobium camelthorni]NGO54688.1 hypothetical protein [Mesorhizobium camelthorni]